MDVNKVEEIRSNQQLIDYINYGNPLKYLCFWGHQPRRKGQVDKSCLSQWYESPFEINGVLYKTAEHFMMAKKATLFSDHGMVKQIISVEQPGEAKKLGREIKGFDDKIWCRHRFDLVVEGNYAKFSQTEELKQFLIQTGSQVLVEASPVDQIWGIGMASDDRNITDPYKWKGLNLLGYALMAVRNKL